MLCIKPSIIPKKNEPKILILIIATGISKKIKFFKGPVATKYLANEPKAPPVAIKIFLTFNYSGFHMPNASELGCGLLS